MKMTLSHRYLDANLDVLDRIGFAKSEAIQSLELVEGWMDDPTARFPVDVFLTLLKLASVRLKDPFLGLRMGHRFRIATFAQTGSIYGYCRDLRQVIEMNGRYQRLAIDVGEIDYVQTGGQHRMRFQPHYEDHTTYRHITDLVMGAYGTAYRWLSWASGEELAGLSLPYAAPEETGIYDKFFQCPVTFNATCGSASLEFSEAAMTQKLTTYDKEKLARAQAQLDQLLGSETAAASLDAAVEAAIRGAIASGRITTHVVADRMGRDWSELKTDLQKSGPGFRDRVDAIRKNMFIEYHEKGHSFAEISQALAYNDQPAFNRAFKRWYGMSPTQWSKTVEAPAK